jgi:enolase-phosphatase E1
LTEPSFEGIAFVLLDIEGTTTPISFVYDTLFPYARTRLRSFVEERATDPDAAHALSLLRQEREGDPTAASSVSIADYAELLMDRDSKSPGLKALQGLIWQEGYSSDALHGIVFDDVPEALRGWRAAGIRAAIYSSGSVLAQRLIFSTTQFGDLTTLFDGFFDTAVGPKREAKSYREIGRRLGCAPRGILFVSDVMPELMAATEAGCQAALIIRPGNPSQRGADTIPTITDLLSLRLSPVPS